ncbi:class E sortase [Streptomyces sp. NPDC059009]|uniref:class E sortase n=1 Tax=Streptomyces sp. NPDC059009 TaxID=3346694 RepID=UPI003690E26B
MEGREVPVVVQGRPRVRSRLTRALWNGAEVAVTLGLVLLLLVVHQLWWTNRQARAGAERKVHALEREWAAGEGSGSGAPEEGPTSIPEDAGASTAPEEPPSGSSPRSPRQRPVAAQPPPPRWDQAYAILRIPRLGLSAPVAEGVSKENVLNRGYVGHYPRTTQPGRPGNFALAGHRNTHGEPFRHINRLRKGDTLTVETKSATYTYVVDSGLPQTSPGDGGVIRPVPRSERHPSAGYRAAGYYITLTTCTPEYTSKYRLVVWGKLRAMKPR